MVESVAGVGSASPGVRRRGRVAGLAAGAVLALGVAACGVPASKVSTGATAPVRSGGSTRAAARTEPAALERAADRTAGVASGRFEMQMTASLMGRDLDVLTANGAFDRAAGRSDLTVDMGGMLHSLAGLLGSTDSSTATVPADLLKLRVVVDGKTIYVQVPSSASSKFTTPWVSADLAGLPAGSNPTGGLDPDTMLAHLRAFTGPLSTVGHESVDGVDTVHEHGQVDVSKIAADAGPKLSAEVRKQLESELTDLGRSTVVPVDVWLDGNGFVRRIRVGVSMSGGGGSDSTGPAAAGTLTITFVDLGKAVTIDVPPADQVTHLDGSKLGSLLGSTAGAPDSLGSGDSGDSGPGAGGTGSAN